MLNLFVCFEMLVDKIDLLYIVISSSLNLVIEICLYCPCSVQIGCFKANLRDPSILAHFNVRSKIMTLSNFEDFNLGA